MDMKPMNMPLRSIIEIITYILFIIGFSVTVYGVYQLLMFVSPAPKLLTALVATTIVSAIMLVGTHIIEYIIKLRRRND